MFSLNLRQKMIGFFCLHLFCYTIIVLTFLEDFDIFTDDVALLIHAGNLSNICLEIRRYEKNYFIGHNNDDFAKVLEYIDKAQHFAPRVMDDLQTMSQPAHLQDISAKLFQYKKNFLELKEQCSSATELAACPLREKVRGLGQELVNISEDLILFEQQKMNSFIVAFKSRLTKTISFLVLLLIFTITILYISIIRPLKKLEKAATAVADGTFSPLPVDKKKGEVHSVMRAFNKMVADLEEQQKRLFQAEKLSSIGTLASGTAHQINNPLNNIATSCQLALAEIDRQQDPFVARMLETINQETDRAGKIVRGLLEFSREQTFTLEPCALTALVDKVKQLVASEVPAGVELRTTIPEDIILQINVHKTTEALLNLTINALQAISEAPGLVAIEAEKDASRTNAVITISDTGRGIDKENLQKLFDPFFTTKNAEKGTGLGLAVAYGIIKKQKGSIRVESEKGKGSRFFVTLPLHRPPEKRDAPRPDTTIQEQ